MALGAWLLLFANQNLTASGPGSFAAEVPLTTYPDNRYPITGFLGNDALEIAANNNQAIVVGAQETPLTADLTVTEGHRHESAETRLSWRQIAAFPFLNNGAFSIGAAPSECYDAILINTTGTPRERANLRLWLSAVELADLIPRVRVSNDNSATTNCNIRFRFYALDMTTLIATYTLTISTATARDREWVDGVTQDLTGAPVDVDVATRYPILVEIATGLDAATENVALHEVAFGVTP